MAEDACAAVAALLDLRPEDGEPTRDFDLLLAVAALEGDEAAVLALLKAEATLRKRPGLDLEAQVDRVAITHLQRVGDVVCELPHGVLIPTLARLEANDATNPELPLEQLAIRFWNAVFPELSSVEYVAVEAPESESEAAIVGEDDD